YYDVYVLVKLKENDIEYDILRQALIETARKRKSLGDIENRRYLIELIAKSDIQRSYWERYRNNYSYVKEIKFESTIGNLNYVIQKIFGD
ncbi:MAG: hypothetical protein LBN34_04330, partial [Clostridiales Family XIII bacterium]|nr:hypothetical protein [Clostridiales Family XIII bacterium]